MKQVVHPRSQTPQGELVAKPGTPLLITLSLICEFDIKEFNGKPAVQPVQIKSPWTETS